MLSIATITFQKPYEYLPFLLSFGYIVNTQEMYGCIVVPTKVDGGAA